MRRTLLFALPALIAIGPGCTCTEGPTGRLTGRIELASGVVDFGDVCVGDGVDYALGVSNVGSVPLAISAVEIDGASAFTVASFPQELASGGRTGDAGEIVVHFAPSAAGDVFADLVITSDDSESPTVKVRLNGGGDPGVRVDPVLLCESDTGSDLVPCEPAQRPILNFGDVAIGSTSEKPVVLSNRGCAVLTVSKVEVANADGFPQGFTVGGEQPPFEVSRSANKTIVPTVAPGESGTYLATLNVTWADESAGADPFVTDAGLMANGVQPQLIVRPSSFVFAEADVSTPQTQTFTIENTGGLETQIDAITLQTENPEFTITPSATLPATLPGYGDFDFDVTYAPQDAGRDVDTVLVSSPEGTLSVPIVGGAVPQIAVDPPATLDFGVVATGQSATESVTVSNAGKAPLNVTRIEFPLNPSNVFAVDSAPPLPQTLQPNQSFTFTVKFTDNPTIGKSADGSGQSEVGELAIVSDDPAYETQSGAYTLLLSTDTLKNLGPEAVLRTYLAGTECQVQPCAMKVGDTASFDASESTDPENDPLSWSWQITQTGNQGAGTATLSSTTGPNVTLTPDFPGRWAVQVTVSDTFGNTATASSELSVSQ